MGASDGPTFAPPKPGSKPIISPPCGCPECKAGPGLQLADRRRAREDRILGTVTKLITYDFCPECRDSTLTTAIRAGSEWDNTCSYGHNWRTTD
jgi:hypothetical protein